MYSVFTPSHRGGSGSPVVCLHGFTDTWRSWDLILPRLECAHDVFAPTLPGHAGGPPLDGEVSGALIPDAIERAMDEAGLASAHIVGNSLGGYVALQLAARGRAESVVALAPAGGWARGDRSRSQTLNVQAAMHEGLKAAAPYAEAIVASAAGRRRATQWITTNYEHIPAGLLAHQIRGAARCDATPFIKYAGHADWHLDAGRSPARSASCGGPLTSSCHGRPPPRAFATTGSHTLTGSSSTASATAPSSMSRPRRRSSSWGSQQTRLGAPRRARCPAVARRLLRGGDRAGRGEPALGLPEHVVGKRTGGGNGEVVAQMFDARCADDRGVQIGV